MHNKYEIAKPVASRPSFLRSPLLSPELLGRVMSPASPSSSLPEHPIPIKPKTTRFMSAQPAYNSAAEVDFLADDAVMNPVPSHLSEKVAPDSCSVILHKPTAKLVSRTAASLLANLSTNLGQTTSSAHFPTQTANHQQSSSSQSEANQLSAQNLEFDVRGNQQWSGGQDRPSYDGYNWRKYGQKQVKGSEYPRSYYKCTYPTCPVKKKVERSFDGHIAEIVYKGEHNHSKPHPPKRLSSASQEQGFAAEVYQGRDASNPPRNAFIGGAEASMSSAPTYCPPQPQFLHDSRIDAAADTSAGPIVPLFAASCGAASVDHDKPDCKRRKIEDQVSGNNSAGDVYAEAQSATQTSMETDVAGDGYHWRKYGQKVVKGNTYPRSYYRCTAPNCSVRKYVERASDDSRFFVTTYEGKHNHEMPAKKESLGASNPGAAAASLDDSIDN